MKKTTDPLAILQVFDRLEIGPVQLSARRLVCPYRLVKGRRADGIDLIYKYEEDVFDPNGTRDLNLASMIAAQVALNYGLFCRKIIFRGSFDRFDRRFLRAMAENTAREIYVKKFLEPNPFLIGSAAHLPVVIKKSYLSAMLEFPDGEPQSTPDSVRSLWRSDHRLHCVLSSGGKDSLLSFALLNEIGAEVHPVFINESGRHWFTAMNAYRYFKKHRPGTARVWVNADRVFAWMLRHFPFIRRDFSALRSDEYPIRLWTVAVFLFGALPLMRKRGIGRLVIGDEHDSTVRATFRGIPHYDGLYDQSRYFDVALSRYFYCKGWGISQFSILRPLSELLIEKILALRYPRLQKEQVSCHAAHMRDRRVYPCGRCEKCRRIVGMLMALGADPTDCGYDKSQIKYCLQDLADQALHQESAAREQLVYMLHEKGLINLSSEALSKIKSHPAILKLRFSSDRSRLNEIPADLRRKLYKIMLSHADGAARKRGRQWEDFNLLADRHLLEPQIGRNFRHN